MTEFLTTDRIKRWQGTYRILPKVDWVQLLEHEFGAPDWVANYPINAKGQPTNQLPPRLACKLFHDSVYIIKKTEENQRFIHERLPDACHRFYKKKQWRKQFFEAMRRISCRLARGVGFRNNCIAEDVFVNIILGMAFELGWRRVNEFTEPLPENEFDRDYNRVIRFAGNEEISNLMRNIEGKDDEADSGKKKSTATKTAGAAKADVRDIKGWFKMYDVGSEHMYDHIVNMHLDEIESIASTTASIDSIDLNHDLSAPHPVDHAADHIDVMPTLPEVEAGGEEA